MNKPIEDLFALADEAVAPVIWTEKKALQKFKEAATPEQLREVAEAFRALQQRAEAAEAKLAELEKQKAVGTVSIAMDWNTHRNIATVNMRPDLVVAEMKDGDELFTRPAPAINLAELVPDVEENEQAFNAGVNALVDCLEDCGDAEQGLRLALRASRAAILRKIEEAK